MRILIILLFFNLFSFYSFPQVLINKDDNEYYFNKINCYPERATNNWNRNKTECQGVTHDDENWFFTITHNNRKNASLWRIPVIIALDQDIQGLPGVLSISMKDIPALNEKKYNHWGDPDKFRYQNIDYILVPMTSSIKSAPAIAFFQSNNLNFVNYCTLPNKNELFNIGWCAVSSTGVLITSDDHTNVLLRYLIEWDKLPELNIDFMDSIILRDYSGIPLNDSQLLHNMQGGEFSPSNSLLYLSCGSGECMGFGNGIYSSDGIHVFETNSWKEVKRSINSKKGQVGQFDFSFNNKCDCLTGSQSPEGLTIWDLDDGRSPNITGQLHVLINFYNKYSLCKDALTFQHFKCIE